MMVLGLSKRVVARVPVAFVVYVFFAFTPGLHGGLTSLVVVGHVRVGVAEILLVLVLLVVVESRVGVCWGCVGVTTLGRMVVVLIVVLGLLLVATIGGHLGLATLRRSTGVLLLVVSFLRLVLLLLVILAIGSVRRSGDCLRAKSAR